MKLVGILLMPAGWVIALGAVALLSPGAAQAAFLLAGGCVEVLGLTLLARSHAVAREDAE
jgi:hypothetical protein